MTLVLRKQRAQDRIEGREPLDWRDDDYAVVDETLIGRIYRQQVLGDLKWLWFLQLVPAPPPNYGMTDTLNEAKAALAKRYEEVKRGNDGSQRPWEFPAMMSLPRLTAEQRRALTILATAGRNGATQALLSAHGFDVSLIADLVNHGRHRGRRNLI